MKTKSQSMVPLLALVCIGYHCFFCRYTYMTYAQTWERRTYRCYTGSVQLSLHGLSLHQLLMCRVSLSLVHHGCPRQLEPVVSNEEVAWRLSPTIKVTESPPHGSVLPTKSDCASLHFVTNILVNRTHQFVTQGWRLSQKCLSLQS